MSFGQWLKDARKSRGFTQRGLADAAGISFSMVSRLENDEVGHSPDMVRRIADALSTGKSEEEREQFYREAKAASVGIDAPIPSSEAQALTAAILATTPARRAILRQLLEDWSRGIDTGVENRSLNETPAQERTTGTGGTR